MVHAPIEQRHYRQSALEVWTAAFVLLLPFQDSFIQDTPLRALGSSLSIVPLAALLFLRVSQFWNRPRSGVPMWLLLGLSYFLFVSALSLVVYGSFSNGTNLIGKAINITILHGVFVFVIFGIDWNVEKLSIYIQAAFLIFVAILFLSDVVGLRALDGFPLHASVNGNDRPRGPALEASTAGAFLISMGCLAASVSKTRALRFFYIILAAVLLWTVRSKGAFAIFVFAVMAATAFGRRTSFRNIFLAVVIGLILGWIVMGDTIQQAANEMVATGSTSVVTRLTLWLTPFAALTGNPLGVGPTGYYPAISHYGLIVGNWLQDITGLPSLFFLEVRDYFFVSTTEAIDTKTYMSNLVMMFGLPGLSLWVWGNGWLLWKVIRSDHANKLYLIAALTYVFLAGSTYVSSTQLFNMAAVYGVSLYVVRKAPSSTA